MLNDFDPVTCIANLSQNEGLKDEDLKARYLDELFKAISKEKGKEITPYLSEILCHKLTKSTTFEIRTKNVSIHFEFRHCL